jgi:hypothetical protein
MKYISFIFLAALILSCEKMEVIENFYTSLGEAEKYGAIEKEWIP